MPPKYFEPSFKLKINMKHILMKFNFQKYMSFLKKNIQFFAMNQSFNKYSFCIQIFLKKESFNADHKQVQGKNEYLWPCIM